MCLQDLYGLGNQPRRVKSFSAAQVQKVTIFLVELRGSEPFLAPGLLAQLLHIGWFQPEFGDPIKKFADLLAETAGGDGQFQLFGPSGSGRQPLLVSLQQLRQQSVLLGSGEQPRWPLEVG